MSKGKKLNIPLIKNAVMFFLGVAIGVMGAFSGIGMQVAAAPTLAFMLGYTVDKQMGTAIAFALFASAAAAIGAGAGGLHIDTTIAVVVAVGAFVGVMFMARAASAGDFNVWRRTAHTVCMALMVYVITAATRLVGGGQLPFHTDWLSGALAYLVFGVAVGALCSYLQMSMAVFVVPSLVFFGTLSPSQAVVTSLVVISVASLLPALSHASQGRVEKGPGFAMIIGGTLGGGLGGYLLGHWMSHSPACLVVFGLVAMFLSAYTLRRNT